MKGRRNNNRRRNEEEISRKVIRCMVKNQPVFEHESCDAFVTKGDHNVQRNCKNCKNSF